MILYGYELSPTIQSTHLIRTNKEFTVIEVERGSGTGLRRFQLFHGDGQNAGVLYEDFLPERFLITTRARVLHNANEAS